MKGLIVIVFYGVIIFVFSFYIGLILDKEIIYCFGILDFSEVYDSVMVDKGFVIEDFLSSK